MVELGLEFKRTDPRPFVPHHWAACLPVWGDGSLLGNVPKVLLLPGCFSFGGWWQGVEVGWGGDRIAGICQLLPQLTV